MTAVADELTDNARDLLAADQVAWFCTLRPDGSPHMTPVWFVFLADTFWVCCTENSAKAANVAGDPRVSVAVGGGEQPIVGEGSARLIQQSDFSAEIRTAFETKYDGWDINTLEQGRWRRVLVEVPVTRWLLAGTPK